MAKISPSISLLLVIISLAYFFYNNSKSSSLYSVKELKLSIFTVEPYFKLHRTLFYRLPCCTVYL
jgi:hypothetical protein